jgi:H+/Cl- antiporter ClcA
MVKKRKQSNREFNHTPTTLVMAFFAGACGFIAVEATLPDLIESSGRQMSKLPGWQVHMGSACGGIIVFFMFLFILQVFETGSRITAWRSSAPWLPLVGLTLFATIIHIPYYVVIPVGAAYCVWAYRLTSRVRSP